MPSRLFAALWRNPWLLLFLCVFFWASNIVAARLAPGEVSPMVLAAMRWLVASAIITPLVWRQIYAERALAARCWLYLTLVSCAGFSFYSILFYSAANFTTGVNIAMLAATVPVFTLVIAWAFLGLHAGPVVIVAVCLTIAGALTVATRGDPGVLLAFSFNRGDLIMIAASVFLAAFTVALRNRPAFTPLVFFALLSIIAFLTSLPAIAIEAAAGASFWPTWTGIAILVYAGTFPTIVSQIFYMRGVELIGPNRTAVFYNMVPVTGALMSVALLSEPFAGYHAVAFVLVLGGIALAEFWRLRQS